MRGDPLGGVKNARKNPIEDKKSPPNPTKVQISEAGPTPPSNPIFFTGGVLPKKKQPRVNKNAPNPKVASGAALGTSLGVLIAAASKYFLGVELDAITAVAIAGVIMGLAGFFIPGLDWDDES